MPSEGSTSKAPSRRTKDPKLQAQGKASKNRGARWERNLVTFFGKVGTRVSRLRSPGAHDLAGFSVTVPLGFNEGVMEYAEYPLGIEAKDQVQINLAGWVAQAERDAKGGLFIVLIKRRHKATGAAYVCTTLDNYLRQMGAIPPEESDEDGEVDAA